MPQYRKKPVIIEAKQWFKQGDCEYVTPYVRNISRVHHLAASNCAKCGQQIHMEVGKSVIHTHGWVDTLEGGHIVCPKDWIITGVKGEHYPCKPDIFDMTYDPV